MMNFKTCGGAAALALSAVVFSGQALAVPVTVAGSTVNFTFDSDLAGIFGTPTVVGDSFSFYPTTFKAQSFNGAGLAHTSQTFNLVVNAKPGYTVSAVNLTEDGDYYNIGTGAAVAVGGKLYVRNLTTPLLPAIISNIVATQPLTATTSLVDFQATNWTATAGVTIPDNWNGQDTVSGAHVTIENILLANSTQLGNGAYIEKKFAGLGIVTSPIPEPQTYALFLSGMGLIGFMAARRSKMSV